MTLQLLPYEFLYSIFEESLIFFFISVAEGGQVYQSNVLNICIIKSRLLILEVTFFLILTARSLKTYIDDAILVAVEETPEEVGQLLQLEGRQLLLEGGVVHSTPV